MKRLNNLHVKTLVYEPTLRDNKFFESTVLNDLSTFKKTCDLIIANRYSHELDDIKEKIFTRDIFQRDWFDLFRNSSLEWPWLRYHAAGIGGAYDWRRFY